MVSRAVSTSFFTSARTVVCQGCANAQGGDFARKILPSLDWRLSVWYAFCRVQTLFCTPAQRRARFPPRRYARRERRERGRERSRRGAHCAPPGEANDRTTDRPSAPGAQIFPAAVKAATYFIAPEQRRRFSGAGCDARRRRMLAGGRKIKEVFFVLCLPR